MTIPHSDNWQSLDYIHDQVVAQIEHQWEVWDAVDGRLRLILGFIGIVFAAALGLRGVSVGGAAVFIPFWVGLLASLAVASYLIAAAIVGIAYLATDFDWPPAPGALRTQYLRTHPRRTKLEVVDTLVAAYARNARLIARKHRAFVWAFTLSAGATIMLGAGLIGNIAWNTYAP